jgi:hypothetical protein
MAKRALPESLLALFTSSDRATAIMGDLEELAQTRGRRWLWTAYLRTLAALGWRTPVAFLAGYAVCQLVASGIEFWILHTSFAWRTAMRSGPFAAMGPLVTAVPLALWFMLSFGLVRYGWRDKFVQLAGASALLASVAFLDPHLLSEVSATILAIVTLVLLAIPAWRRAVVVLLSSVVAGSLVAIAISFGMAIATMYLSEQLHPGRLIPNQHPSDIVVLLAFAIVCSSLHSRLLRSPEIGGTHAELV